MFNRPNEDYGDLIPIVEWIESVHMYFFTPDDGSGYWANETHHIDWIEGDDQSNVFDLKNRPQGATHVLWFNK